MGRSDITEGCKGWAKNCDRCKYGKLVYSPIIRARVFCCEYNKDGCEVTKAQQERERARKYDKRRMQAVVNDN